MITQMKRAASEVEGAEIALFKNKISRLEDINHIVVHNLRGVASNIKMLVEVLVKSYVQKDEDAAKKSKTFTLEQGLSLIGESSTSLINTLSELMKGLDLSGGRASSPEFELCDIGQITAGVSQQLNGFIREKNANLCLMLGVSEMEYPKCYMESIVYNFISNALKYSRPDVAPEIKVCTYRQEGRVVLSVKDNGLGIDLDRYGDRVFNLNQVFHEGHDSKGIGLFITRKQIESLGGSITVKSKVNEGCEFIVTF